MKMKLPLLCRNTRAATETAVKLTRLSKVELFCARNWGKPQIKHLVREARVELSRKAVSVDGANWVYDTIPQGSLPPFPLAEVERYFNTGMIVINAQNQTGVEPDVKMYPRLRFCCKAVGYYVMSYQFLPAPIEETIGLYFYNRIEELNLDSDPEADSSVTEDWAMEVNPAFKLPGEELTLHKADGSLSRMGLVWAPDGIDHIAMLIKVYNKEGQSLLLLERPEGSMFFNQERLAWAYNQSVIVTDDPQAFLVNRCDKDFVMLGCFGDVRENTAESLALFRGRKVYWAIPTFSEEDLRNAVHFLDVMNKIGKEVQFLRCFENRTEKTYAEIQTVSLDTLIAEAEKFHVAVPERITLRHCGFVDPAAMSTRREHAAVICGLIQRGEVTVIEESPAVPAWIVCKTLLKIRRQNCKQFLGHVIPARLPKLVVFCAQEDAMNFAQLLDADETTTVCSLPCDWNGDELQAHVRQAVERVRASLILLAVPSSKTEKNILAPLMWYCRRENLSLLVESRLGHEEKKAGTEFESSADRCCRLLSARKNNRLKVMLEEQDEAGEVRCSMVTLAKGFLGGCKPATPEERALFYGHSRTVDQGDDLSFKQNRFMQEEL
jgi:hypothetical protein